MQPQCPTAIRPILDAYLLMLDRWNQVHALTALPPEARFEELILDSCALLPFLSGLKPGAQIMDFGTGMGIPSVVLAAAKPDLQVVALDKARKKMAFLQQVVRELKLTNLNPTLARSEDLPPVGATLGTAKAVGSLPLLLSWWERHGAPGAPLLALKGPEWRQEPQTPPGWSMTTHVYELPTKGERFILELTKREPREAMLAGPGK